jgi:long-chain acyl-CoA synthetase
MAAGRPYRWEKSYPPGVRWDAPLEVTTLGALIDGARAHGARPAIDFHDREITYTELTGLVDRAAAGFLTRGLAAGRPVAFYLSNTPYHPIAFFAAQKAGARVVHLSPLDAERVLAFKLADSGARTLVTTSLGALPAMAQKLLDAGTVDRIIVGDEAMWGGAPLALACDGERVIAFADLLAAAPPPVWPAVRVDDVALIQYTGGTTGTPKGALLTHGNLTAAVSMYDVWANAQGLYRPGEERALCVLPLFHIYALTTVLLRHIKAGNCILLRERFSVDGVLRDIEEKRATAFAGVPTMWIALAATPGLESRDLSSLRVIGSGAAPLPVEVADRFERLTGKRLGGGWGMTETSPAGTNLPRDGGKPGSIGLPLPGITIEIVALDDPHRVLGPNGPGELRIKGANVTKGYWNRPEETKSAFVDGFLLTGDVGTMDEDGYVFLLDRRKDMIISGGFNVYPTMVERAIYEHPAVEEAVVVGTPDPYRGEAAKVFVKLRAGAPPFTLDELRAFLADKLGRHEMPAALEFRASLPKTPVGKLSRKELAEAERGKAALAAEG